MDIQALKQAVEMAPDIAEIVLGCIAIVPVFMLLVVIPVLLKD